VLSLFFIYQSVLIKGYSPFSVIKINFVGFTFLLKII
jgi:hypothetical protein